MSQNPLYLALGGKRNNRLFSEAKALEKTLTALNLPNFGITASGQGGQRVNPEDFEANDIDTAFPANFEIRTSMGNGPDKNDAGEEIENSIADYGEYQSVDKLLDTLEMAPNLLVGAERIICMFHPSLKGQELNTYIDNLPTVRTAVESARTQAIHNLLKS
jgi:hypothetical protein